MQRYITSLIWFCLTTNALSIFKHFKGDLSFMKRSSNYDTSNIFFCVFKKSLIFLIPLVMNLKNNSLLKALSFGHVTFDVAICS